MTESLLLTLELALWTSVVVLLGGSPLAWLVARRHFPGRRILESLLLLPLVLPPTVLGFYLLVLLGDSGPLARWFDVHWAFRFEGILVGSVIFNLPFALSSYREAFRSLDDDLLQAARTLGASRWRVMSEVVLPLAWPGLLSGTLLAFAHTLGEFGVVLMIGGSIPGETRVVSVYLFELTQALRLREAHEAAVLLLAMAFALLYAIRLLETRWKSATGSAIPWRSTSSSR